MKTQLFSPAIVLTALLLGPAKVAVEGAISFGTYPLANHPAGDDYGLRLDELVNLTGGNDSFVFDFDHPDSNLQLTYAPATSPYSSVRIFGTVHGGLQTSGGLDPNYTANWLVDFTYQNVRNVTGDDDLRYLGANTEAVWGAITGTTPAGMIAANLSFLSDPYAWNPVFRVGDGNDDLGHLGFAGTSGWGQLEHSASGDPGTWGSGYTSEWLFVVVPEPGTFWVASLLGAAIMIFRPGRRSKPATPA